MTKYRESVVENICKLIAKGVNQKTAAICSDISEKTFYEWMEEKSEFRKLIQKAKDSALRTVEDALYQKAAGKVRRTEKIRKANENGKMELVETRAMKYAPDVGALVFWLCNKHPDLWENIQKKIHSGEIRILTAADIDNAIKEKEKKEKDEGTNKKSG